MPIPIAFAADNGYIFPLLAALGSLARNKNADTSYDIYILVPGNFTQENRQRIERLLAPYESVGYTLIDMKESYADVPMRISHITAPTYYRLRLASLLPNINKCLYLDSDIIVNEDLTEFFNREIGDSYIAGVRAAAFIADTEGCERLADYLGIEKADRYVNAGVLIMQLDKIRADCLEQRFNELVQKGFSCQDQDILNSACYDRIAVLPPKFNLMTRYNPANPSEAYNEFNLRCAYTQREWHEACSSPLIVHFADKRKPWTNLESVFAEDWWRTVTQCGFLPECFENYYSVICQRREEDISCSIAEVNRVNQALSSLSWRIGRFITFILRVICDKIRDVKKKAR